MPSDADDKEFYDSDRQMKNIGVEVDLEGMRVRKAHDTASRLAFIRERLLRGKSLLDIGCGYGFFVGEAERAGYRAAGLERSKERRALASRVTQAPIFDIDLFRAGSKLGRYDLVTAFHVLEHVTRPIRFLARIREHLAKGGRLIIEVPNLDDHMIEASPAYRSFTWQRAHVSYFSPASLRRVLEAAGYKKIEVVGVQRYGLANMMNWMVTGKPQIEAPDFRTRGSLGWLEMCYKRRLEKGLKSDALLAVASP